MGIFIKICILHILKFHLHTLSCHFWLNLWLEYFKYSHNPLRENGSSQLILLILSPKLFRNESSIRYNNHSSAQSVNPPGAETGIRKIRSIPQLLIPWLLASPVSCHGTDRAWWINFCLPWGRIFNTCAINSLWPSDVTWQHRSGSWLAQVMACCLMATSHYLNQCWLITEGVLWHSQEMIMNLTHNNTFSEITLLKLWQHLLGPNDPRIISAVK